MSERKWERLGVSSYCFTIQSQKWCLDRDFPAKVRSRLAEVPRAIVMDGGIRVVGGHEPPHFSRVDEIQGSFHYFTAFIFFRCKIQHLQIFLSASSCRYGSKLISISALYNTRVTLFFADSLKQNFSVTNYWTVCLQ